MAIFFKIALVLLSISYSFQINEFVEPHVVMPRNTLTYRYLTADDSTVSSILSSETSSSLILHDHGDDRFLRKYESSDQQIDWINWTDVNDSDSCEKELNISSTPAEFYTSPPGDTTEVTIYTKDPETSEKYYLRVNVLTNAVTLECEEAFHNSTLLKQREFHFDLLAIPVSRIN